jgi:hypothetical protein
LHQLFFIALTIEKALTTCLLALLHVFSPTLWMDLLDLLAIGRDLISQRPWFALIRASRVPPETSGRRVDLGLGTISCAMQ